MSDEIADLAADEDLAPLIGLTHFGILAFWVYAYAADWPPTEPRPVMPGMGIRGVLEVGYA